MDGWKLLSSMTFSPINLSNKDKYTSVSLISSVTERLSSILTPSKKTFCLPMGFKCLLLRLLQSLYWEKWPFVVYYRYCVAKVNSQLQFWMRIWQENHCHGEPTAFWVRKMFSVLPKSTKNLHLQGCYKKMQKEMLTINITKHLWEKLHFVLWRKTQFLTEVM